MVAVMATAVREFEGILSAYDTFTGVRPNWRGRRLAGRMFEFAREQLEQRGVRRFLLEVIETNEPAIRAYERAGFTTRRRLECYELAGAFLRAVATGMVAVLIGISLARRGFDAVEVGIVVAAGLSGAATAATAPVRLFASPGRAGCRLRP